MRPLARKLVGGVGGGGGSAVAALSDGSVITAGFGTQSAGVRLANDGKIYTEQNGFFSLNGTWLISGTLANFEARCTVVSGVPIGPTATWVALTSTRDWTVIDNTDDGVATEATITLEIRNASSLAVLATGTWQLIASTTTFS
jgi:hypothetical protein